MMILPGLPPIGAVCVVVTVQVLQRTTIDIRPFARYRRSAAHPGVRTRRSRVHAFDDALHDGQLHVSSSWETFVGYVPMK